MFSPVTHHHRSLSKPEHLLQTLRLKTAEDDVDEPAGRITVSLLGGSSGNNYHRTYLSITAFVTVRDRLSQLLPFISISANSDSVVEGNDVGLTISSATIAPQNDLDIGIFIREKGEFLTQKPEKIYPR